MDGAIVKSAPVSDVGLRSKLVAGQVIEVSADDPPIVRRLL
jgi:hypothetical protein